MQLDSRIIEGKKPLTCFDTEEAKQFLGKWGYFNNNLNRFCYLKNCNRGCLRNIFVQNEKCFVSISDYPDTDYKYFLPAEWVKNEPEWRPYLIDDWLQEHNFGDMIEFRTKTNHIEITAMFIGMDSGPQNGETRIMLGGGAYSFDLLFEHYELIDKTHDGKFAWRPFGIEVK